MYIERGYPADIEGDIIASSESPSAEDVHGFNRINGIYLTSELRPYFDFERTNALADDLEILEEMFPSTFSYLNSPDLPPLASESLYPVLSDQYFHQRLVNIINMCRERRLSQQDLESGVEGILTERVTAHELQSRQSDKIRVIGSEILDQVYEPSDSKLKVYIQKYRKKQPRNVRADVLVLRPFPSQGITLLEGVGEITAGKIGRHKKEQLSLYENGDVVRQLYTDPEHSEVWGDFVEQTILSRFDPNLVPQRLVFDESRYHPFLVMPRSGSERPGTEYLPISKKELQGISKNLVADQSRHATNNIIPFPAHYNHRSGVAAAGGD